jgi:putative SOS response-associated peptidase YedK
MCGRYTLAGPDPSALRERFALGDRIAVRRRFNVAPGDDVVAVTTDRDGVPRGDVLRWGLVPSWARDPRSLGLKLINARAETMATNGAFRGALERQRCLVVADGFFEWERRPGRPKQPYRVTRADGAPFAFAGLWASWRGDDGVEPLRTCTIVTTTPSAALARIHDRMPVMLEPGAEDVWLDHATRPAALRELCVPCDDTATVAVGPAVNDARHDEPDCLRPADPAGEPATLF